jgi:hypothetical protein
MRANAGTRNSSSQEREREGERDREVSDDEANNRTCCSSCSSSFIHPSLLVAPPQLFERRQRAFKGLVPESREAMKRQKRVIKL